MERSKNSGRRKYTAIKNELRDFYGTHPLHHRILEQEINPLQGRIPPSIFIKHYWSPKLSEPRDRIFEALTELEQTINN